jgi:hypothetical protein
MSWKEEKTAAIKMGLLEWRSGVQLHGKGGWYDIRIVGNDGNKRGEPALKLCGPQLIGWAALPTAFKPLELSYPAFDPPCASSHIRITTFLTYIYRQIIQNDYYRYALWSRVDASQAPVASPKSSFTSS